MRLDRKTRAEIAGRSIAGLARYKDSDGHRLHPDAIAQEIRRRIEENKKQHPKVLKQASRVLGKGSK